MWSEDVPQLHNPLKGDWRVDSPLVEPWIEEEKWGLCPGNNSLYSWGYLRICMHVFFALGKSIQSLLLGHFCDSQWEKASQWPDLFTACIYLLTRYGAKALQGVEGFRLYSWHMNMLRLGYLKKKATRLGPNQELKATPSGAFIHHGENMHTTQWLLSVL